MKKNKIIISLLISAFIGSFFMPAYPGYEKILLGYACAMVSLNAFLEIGKDIWSLYYAVFTFSNLLTIFFLFSLFMGVAQSLKFLKGIGNLLIIHLLSWPIINWASIGNLKIGFYFWALSIIITWFLYCFYKNENENIRI